MEITKAVHLANEVLLPTYVRNEIEFVKGKNALLWDSRGNKYIDFLSGLGVTNLGHRHWQVIQALKKATCGPLHVTNLFQISKQARLAGELLPPGFEGKSFFGNSGTEANEAAYKFAIKYGKAISSSKIKMLTAVNSFHGRTFAALNLTGQKKIKQPFSPLLPHVEHFELNDTNDFLAKMNDDIAAVVLECVQGEGGVYVASPGFVATVAKKCREHKALLLIDEVQSGNFRTGKQYAFLHYDIEVDGFTTAKALANGLPIGAFTIRSRLASVFAPGDHGSTFGGNPLVTQVGLATLQALKKLERQGLLQKKIKLFSKYLADMKIQCPGVKEVRQLGMMIGIEFESGQISATAVAKTCLGKGLIVNNIGDKIIRLLPPLVIKPRYIKKGMGLLQRAISEAGRGASE